MASQSRAQLWHASLPPCTCVSLCMRVLCVSVSCMLVAWPKAPVSLGVRGALALVAR